MDAIHRPGEKAFVSDLISIKQFENRAAESYLFFPNEIRSTFQHKTIKENLAEAIGCNTATVEFLEQHIKLVLLSLKEYGRYSNSFLGPRNSWGRRIFTNGPTNGVYQETFRKRV